MNLWWIIATAVIVTAGLRVLPVFLSRLPIKNSKKFLSFLDYAACSAIGSMIYVAAFYHMGEATVSNNKLSFLLCNALILVIAFLLSLKLKKPIRVFLICMVLYLIMNIIIFG